MSSKSWGRKIDWKIYNFGGMMPQVYDGSSPGAIKIKTEAMRKMERVEGMMELRKYKEARDHIFFFPIYTRVERHEINREITVRFAGDSLDNVRNCATNFIHNKRSNGLTSSKKYFSDDGTLLASSFAAWYDEAGLLDRGGYYFDFSGKRGYMILTLADDDNTVYVEYDEDVVEKAKLVAECFNKVFSRIIFIDVKEPFPPLKEIV